MVKTSMVWQTTLESTTLLEANSQPCNNTVRVFAHPHFSIVLRDGVCPAAIIKQQVSYM